MYTPAAGTTKAPIESTLHLGLVHPAMDDAVVGRTATALFCSGNAITRFDAAPRAQATVRGLDIVRAARDVRGRAADG